MITVVTAETSQGGLLTLPLDDELSGILISEIEGLDPVKATLVSSSYARRDGAQYNSSRRETRNMIFHIDLEPDYVLTSVSDLRKQLYSFFMPKSKVMFQFHQDDGVDVKIEGIIEDCKAPRFTKEPKMDVVVTCFDPDFFNPEDVDVAGNTTATTTEETVNYAGTVETGVKFSLFVNRSLSEFTIYHRTPDGSMRSLEFAAPLVAGDLLVISTVPGSKYVRLTRAGVTTSLLYAMSPYSNWIELQPGDNFLRVYAEGAAIPYTFEYIERFGGL